jgi:hypothetical protein
MKLNDAALIVRSGNAALPVAGPPQPNFVAPDLPALAAKFLAKNSVIKRIAKEKKWDCAGNGSPSKICLKLVQLSGPEQ